MKMMLAAALVAGALPLSVGSPKTAAGVGTGLVALGMIPHPASPAAFDSPHLAGTDMTYHGGWVMRTNTTYAIYWVPSGSTCGASDPGCSGYRKAIDRYFKDVAAASGSNSNVYSVDTQYYDTTGSIAYQSTFGGAVIDGDPFPPYNPSTSCIDGADPVCLTDDQGRAEIQKVISEVGWPDGESSLFSLMTPDSVGWCHNDNKCTGINSCAFHGRFTGADSQPIVYTVEPFAATDGCAGNPPNPTPNGDAADPTINLISHEMNEAITDPWGDGWYAGDTSHEIADPPCAWTFGNPLGTAPNGQAYNEVINGDEYWLQQEWSNDGSHCVQRHVPGVNLPTNLAAPVVTGAAGVGQLLRTSNGRWAGTPTSYWYRWQRCAGGNTGCKDIAGAAAATYRLEAADEGSVVRSEVVALNAAGASAAVLSASTDLVVSIPTSTAPPVLSGRAGVGRTFVTSTGAWNPPVSKFAYQWLRCAADGSSCTPIPGASKAAYVLVAADAGHTLEARVSATDAAGTTAALSNHSRVVVALPASIKAPHISGRARIGKKLSGSHGSWTNSPTAYRYQWLRCNKRGRSCTGIGRATHPSYRLTKRDAGHRLRLRVIALNLAGSRVATSLPTARIPTPHQR
jgi:hypothetical protein